MHDCYDDEKQSIGRPRLTFPSSERCSSYNAAAGQSFPGSLHVPPLPFHSLGRGGCLGRRHLLLRLLQPRWFGCPCRCHGHRGIQSGHADVHRPHAAIADASLDNLVDLGGADQACNLIQRHVKCMKAEAQVIGCGQWTEDLDSLRPKKERVKSSLRIPCDKEVGEGNAYILQHEAPGSSP